MQAEKAKPVHLATKINKDGGVSALCFDPPRAIDLTRATWTNRAAAVTCKWCKRKLAKQEGST
jgi:hypothetical protein